MENLINKFSGIDIKTVDIDTLMDIQNIRIDETMPKQERIQSFIEQIKNPYCFRCGNTIVKVNFANHGETMEEKIKKIILS